MRVWLLLAMLLLPVLAGVHADSTAPGPTHPLYAVDFVRADVMNVTINVTVRGPVNFTFLLAAFSNVTERMPAGSYDWVTPIHGALFGSPFNVTGNTTVHVYVLTGALPPASPIGPFSSPAEEYLFTLLFFGLLTSPAWLVAVYLAYEYHKEHRP